jgi:tetratricopeptide (TPR) repeat protein
MVGGREQALRALQEAIRLGEAAGGMTNLAGWFNTVAGTYLESGEFGLSQLYCARGLEVAERQGDILRTMFLTSTRGCIAFYTGNWSQALADFKWVEDLSRELGASRAYLGALHGLATLYLAQGEQDTASQYLEEGRALAEQTHNLGGVRQTACLLAERDVLEGRPDLACARLVPLLDRPGLEEVDVDPLLVYLAWATLEQGDEATADQVVTQVVRRLRADNRRLTLVDALRVQAMIATRQRCWAKAEQALEEGLALARGMPYPYAEARLLHVSGALHAQKGEPEPAHQRLEEALAIFRRLGARKDVERVEQATAELLLLSAPDTVASTVITAGIRHSKGSRPPQPPRGQQRRA